ncbi:hypothetical protein [Tautonia sociabilis]|uniref:Uncharacterized protein n=1 Tax=Tautonia sociabilis TaxID=2080755 RepID=A0A432MR16_9BACT|nr:hypothetical protein [Tautonia sociabilis]RUL89446.1 hypothetical protein TsocGM_01350 [Tautonia sociabilis]
MTNDIKIRVLNIDYHRNGIGGAPFHAIVFRDSGELGSVKLAVVSDQAAHVAVLDIAKLVDCDVEFGSNSWRGDQYEPGLRRAIRRRERQIEKEALGGKEA